MAFNDDQQESPLPIGSATARTSVDFLPRYFRTSTNQKFLNATLDQMISEGQVEKVNAFIGRKTTDAYKVTDTYLEDVSNQRTAYQLEPALTIKDSLNNYVFFKDYNDYINQLDFFNSSASNQDLVNSQEFYAWDPHIDWDKFINYREYYWLPSGPQSIPVLGQSQEVISTYTVRLANETNNQAYLFLPDGLTRNPTLTLYRGQTYRFEIDCADQPLAIKTDRISGDSFFYTQGVSTGNSYVGSGVIEFEIPQDAPNILYYVSKNDINSSGIFKIFDITESTKIDIETEVIGKKTYVLRDGTPLSNGMRIFFQGLVTPAKYATDNWYVEGVGNSIYLIAESDLITPASYASNEDIEFDNERFDTQGYDVNANYPFSKDYILINRGSKDRNPWSRYNRWFHRQVIETSAAINNQPVILDQGARAIRPIIEFESGLVLWNHGKQAKQNVTLVDNFTTDIFSKIEGSLGYNVDGVDLIEGMRVLFTADTDIRVSGRIFRISFVTHLGTRRITLISELGTDPLEGETALVLQGNINSGNMYYYKDGRWRLAQQKTSVNQSPLFDMFNAQDISYGDKSVYVGSTFVGTKLFGYAAGNTLDPELKFGISYRNIGNIGDIVFDFNLHTDSFLYQSLAAVRQIKLDRGYLKKSDGLLSTLNVNGWTNANTLSRQFVVRQYDASDRQNFFAIDVYDNSSTLIDLEVRVWVNGKSQSGITDYSIFRENNIAYVDFIADLKPTDSVIIKTRSASPKNQTGYYEFPNNLESNPLNISMDDFTLGEISNHLRTIVENNPQVIGTVPGPTNLRDLSNLAAYGRKIIQHSGPLAIAAYHITDKDYNIIKALRFAKSEYSKFKRNFLRIAETYGFDGDGRIHLDLLLQEAVKDNVDTMPYYFSDMVPFSGDFIYEQQVIDDSITQYPIIFDFDLTTPNQRAVLVYLNDQQLIHGREYEFVNSSFVNILVPIREDDNIKIVQYESTDGCYIPPTPTKLGLYPLYEPKIFIDDTYQTPTKVIQGHDGSITVAFDDYRDDLILEFEKRIFNNIKVEYDLELLDIGNFITGYYRKTDLETVDFNNTLRQEFLNWSRFVAEDYTKHTFFDRNNPFTFNFKKFAAPDTTSIPGFWRAIYNYFYDTDRPHSHPWEMLGFSIEPKWWRTIYGPAPYTSDNLILWTDIAEGIIKEPGKLLVRKPQYARTTILSHLPVDQHGVLLSPLDSNVIRDYVAVFAENEFTFGDGAPIESAWRKNSEYPFALITTLMLLRPAKLFAVAYDRLRQIRDSSGQIVYKVEDGNLRFSLDNIVFPTVPNESSRNFTSGLVNYICEYATSQSQDSCENYKLNLRSLDVKLASKLGGFTSKEKFKLILDSRSPLNQSNVFVPEENYDIILNTSSPVISIDYSGVIIEKQPSGLIIKGYNQSMPEFKYYKHLETVSDPVTNIGGISESFLDWDTDKFYNKSQIVRYDNNFFRVTTSHTSSETFELKYFVKLPQLPVIGGRNIIIRRRFDDEISTLHYGAELEKVQDVVDFMLGYNQYLLEQGFNFEYFNSVLETVTDWETSIKEFVFWTTQNWAAGSVIALSPGADEIVFSRPFSVVDNIYDNFYEYSIYKQDGLALEPLFTNSVRKGNSFTLRPRNTADGVYHVTLNLVQKEHVLILDNRTVFNDVIYDQTQGYRQERIKLTGYRTAAWQGDFNIPGFVYDRATVSEWRPWKDYSLGSTAKYKEFYYSAKKNVPGSELFDNQYWYRLPKKPESRLIPNWDYRANQFPDFYDLDTDSFDVTQQKFAQHLIGYQNRQYLQNIINDDVAQYKFYQGMIREKGTQNVLSKLFDTFSAADKESIDFYEEWAVRIGQYGAVDAFKELEYKIDEEKILINPQPFELVNRIDRELVDFVYRYTPDQVYVKPEGYNHNPFPTIIPTGYFVETAGYVRADDVDFVISSKSQLGNYSLTDLKQGSRFWLGYDRSTWNVLRFGQFAREADNIEFLDPTLKITLTSNRDIDIQIGDFIGINTDNNRLDGIFQVVDIGFNSITINPPSAFTEDDVTLINFSGFILLYKFSTVRTSSIDSVNELYLPRKTAGDLIWVDGVNNRWQVWQYNDVYTVDSLEDVADTFGKRIAVDDQNRIMAVAADNRVLYFTRSVSQQPWIFRDEIGASSAQALTDTNNSFGDELSLSKDGAYLLISAPDADRVSGDSSNTDAEGYVAVYKKNSADIFVLNEIEDGDGNAVFDGIIKSPDRNQFEYFGFKTAIFGRTVCIISKGSLSTPASLNLFDIDGEFLDRYQFANGVQTTDLSVSGAGTVVVSLDDETIHVFDADTAITLTQVLEFGQLANAGLDIGTGSNFASSVAITRDGKSIAAGAPGYSGTNVEEGCVVMYNLDVTYQPVDLIVSPTRQESGRFGDSIRFNLMGDQLVAHARTGDQTFDTTFDNNRTTFDLGSTAFAEIDKFTGAVFVFDKYDTKYVFADSLENKNLGSEYGQGLFVTDRIYIGDPTPTQGAVYEFKSDKKTWSVYRQPTPSVDIKKIKSIFLYDTEKNNIISYLDFVDPLQGKIIGLAEQELRYKTYYDPATYTLGTADVVVDTLDSWTKAAIGQLWWDLSAVKFFDVYQGTAAYKANTWNARFDDAAVEVYEWVESTYSPSQWDELADTEEGLTLGISGRSKYGDLAYSIDQTYDSLTQNYSNKYYFWVKNKVTVPDVEFRKYSANDVAGLIQDPKSKGVKYAALLGPNQWALINCKELIAGNKVAINFRYWTVDNIEINIHSHYQLLTDGDISRRLNSYVEQKWIDSLVGSDVFNNPVPDPELSPKLKYGILNKPRQSMFVNRTEATKQFVERVNAVLIKKNLVDDFDLSGLEAKEDPPGLYSRSYDIVKPTHSELRFVGTAAVETPALTPIIINGKITGVDIVLPGKGYVDVIYNSESIQPRRGPNISINGTGEGAQITCEIDAQGKITAINVEKQGKNYSSATTLTVRPFTVLIESDETATLGWSLYTWKTTSKSWERSKTQTYDVTKYWRRADWYAEGFNEFIKIDHIVDFAYELPTKNIQIGQVVKIKNQGSAGWLLLKKIGNKETTDTTVNYQTIGRQEGTIQINDNVYRFSNNNVGYDGPTYDDDIFDDEPTEEFRIILNVLKNNIFIDDLELEYNQLFFASLRYVFQEQIFVDWAFKTSFVRGKHNLGELKQKVTYQNDNLESYEDYINEVKPYRTKVREFVSAYDRLEQTRSTVTDFDLPAVYDFSTGNIRPVSTSVENGILTYDNNIVLTEPYDSWYYNSGHVIEEITVVDGGLGYTNSPVVTILGLSTVSAQATAYVSQGRVTRITVDNQGEGYLSTPIIELDGGQPLGGIPARVAIKLGAGPVRSNKIGIKFDRINPKYTISNQVKTETFANVSGSQTRFNLTWPADLRLSNITVAVSGIELLDSDYSVSNVKDTTASYTRYYGRVTFDTAPTAGETVSITYYKDINLMDAADRIQYYYTSPRPGQLGQDLGQLMQGVDYGGVQITGIDFNIGSGWDSLPWGITGWDSFDSQYTDQLFRSDGTSRTFTLGFVPADFEEINIYVNNIRVDDPNYDIVSSAQLILSEEQQDLDDLQVELAVLQGIAAGTAAALIISQSQQAQAQLDTVTALLAYDAAIINFGAGSPEAIAAESVYVSAQAAEVIANNNAVSATSIDNIAQANVLSKQTEIVAQSSMVSTAQAVLNALTPIANENAEMNTIYGDGSTDTFILPSTVTLSGDQIDNDVFDNIIFRKATSDGSFVPQESTYDIELTGGNLSYSSARGINAEEINIDGDGFVTVVSSHAPEEIVTGQLLDTVDIQVLHKVSDGAPTIVTKHYIAYSRTAFNIGQRPGTDNSVIVKINGLVKRLNVDYIVDFVDQQIILTSVPSSIDEITVTSLSQNGLGILDLDFFVGDGSTVEFITAARWNGDYSAFVTVNGLVTGVAAFIADETYVRPSNIGIRFSQAPAKDSIINYTILNSFVNTVSKIEQELIPHDGVNSTYELINIPAFVEPLENHVIVEANGRVLRSVDTYYFTVSGTNRTYTVDSADYPFNTIDPTDIKIFKNGELLQQAKDWTWSSGTNQLKIKQGVAVTGDVIALAVLQDAEYFIEGIGSTTTIRFVNSHVAGTIIAVTSFTNHDLLEIQRSNDVIISTATLTAGSASYQKFNQLSQGRIKLENTIVGPQYVWVMLNNKLLTPSVDYILESDLQTVIIEKPLALGDVVEVMTFNSNTTRTAFGYRIFKDMLNSVIYKRFDDSITTTLVDPLRYYDPRIVVVNAAGLTEPNANLNQPGIVFIAGERIEYLKKTGNVLSQLRRGTLGTGIAESYPVGTKIRDQSQGHTVPYNDLTVTSKLIADGSSQILPIDFIPMKNHMDNGGAYKTAADWINEGFVTSFLFTAIQADDIDVFVGGRRLRKHPVRLWRQDLGPDSPSGDTVLDAEFAVDGVTATVQIADDVIPVDDDGVQLPVIIVVQKRTGRLWTQIGESLSDSVLSPAKFIRAKSVDLSGDQSIVVVAPTVILTTEDNRVLTDENGNPLEWS